MLAFDNRDHSSRLVRSNIVPDYGVGTCEVVACQKESLRRLELLSEKTKRRSLAITFSHEICLERLHVLGLPALRPLGYVELHRLPLLKASETPRLDGREMHKNVFATLTADETVALGVVEPLYCSLVCHIDTRVPFN